MLSFPGPFSKPLQYGLDPGSIAGQMDGQLFQIVFVDFDAAQFNQFGQSPGRLEDSVIGVRLPFGYTSHERPLIGSALGLGLWFAAFPFFSRRFLFDGFALFRGFRRRFERLDAF
jgi:hypothetical protein